MLMRWTLVRRKLSLHRSPACTRHNRMWWRRTCWMAFIIGLILPNYVDNSLDVPTWTLPILLQFTIHIYQIMFFIIIHVIGQSVLSVISYPYCSAAFALFCLNKLRDVFTVMFTIIITTITIISLLLLLYHPTLLYM